MHSRGASASELVYRHYMKEIPRERVWLALYGAIADYADETPFSRERIRNWDRRGLYFEVSTISLGIKNDEFADYDAKRRIVRTLSRGGNPSDVPGLVRSAKRAVNREFELYELIKKRAQTHGSVAYVKDVPSFGFRGPSALFAATVQDTRIGICAHTRERYVDITMRTRDYSLRLNTLADRAAEAVGGSGGGHASAAGAKIPKGTFRKFLDELNKHMR
jgi:single-stranded-DNA-specific exonuclease